MDWTDYHPLEDMYSYWDYLEATYEWISTETIGQSYEGTDMRVLKVCRDATGCGNKPAMWFDGGIHAREWVSPAVATYMAMELIENDDAHPDLTKELDWFVVVALEHSRVLANFCSTVFTSDHLCIESKQCTLNTWVV